jgi:hypothetical protein
MASPLPTIRLLPLPDGECSPAEELLACAEALGIPWRRLLAQEIEAEQKLRTYLPEIQTDGSWEAALEILSTEAARSWRVRDRLETLAWEARGSVRGAARSLRGFVRSVAGAPGSDPAPGIRQCGTAYRRILILQRARRAAARSRGTTAERLAFVCSSARCKFEDAEWALGLLEADSPRRGRRMEAAVRKVRDEGYFVPRAATEARSLSQLRRIVFGFRDASSKNRRVTPS